MLLTNTENMSLEEKRQYILKQISDIENVRACLHLQSCSTRKERLEKKIALSRTASARRAYFNELRAVNTGIKEQKEQKKQNQNQKNKEQQIVDNTAKLLNALTAANNSAIGAIRAKGDNAANSSFNTVRPDELSGWQKTVADAAIGTKTLEELEEERLEIDRAANRDLFESLGGK